MAKLAFTALLYLFILYLIGVAQTKIVLPHKLRYLENMLNSEVMARAAKIRQQMETNPNLGSEVDKGWPAMLAKYQPENLNRRLQYQNMN